jgi:hypothetical protein
MACGPMSFMSFSRWKNKPTIKKLQIHLFRFFVRKKSVFTAILPLEPLA